MTPTELQRWFDQILVASHSDAVDDILSTKEVSESDAILFEKVREKGVAPFKLPRLVVQAGLAPLPSDFMKIESGDFRKIDNFEKEKGYSRRAKNTAAVSVTPQRQNSYSANHRTNRYYTPQARPRPSLRPTPLLPHEFSSQPREEELNSYLAPNVDSPSFRAGSRPDHRIEAEFSFGTPAEDRDQDRRESAVLRALDRLEPHRAESLRK